MKAVSLSQQAYEGIKRKIVSLELSPGAVIDESILREELGLGRTPIREALKRLSLEKLVTIVPRRGMFVTEIGISDLQQLFEVRLTLEGLAARLAARRGAAEDWDRMEEILTFLPGGTSGNELLVITDQECHEIIYNAADNAFLKHALTTHYALSMRLWYFFLSKIGDMRPEVLEHRRILDALRAGNEDEADLLMQRHIGAFQERIQSIMFGLPIQSGQVQLQGEML